MRDHICPGGITKPQLAAAIAAIDDWIDSNQASFNSALPTAFRTTATTAEKAELFGYVLWRRIGKLKTQED
jgi:hypothetical protein